MKDLLKKTKVLVGLSGGVDSCLSAKLLKSSGYEVLGCYLRMFTNDDYHNKNIAKIKIITEYLGIDFLDIDLRQEFDTNVYKPFVQDYLNGKTPNPCALCNRNIKFQELINIADKNDCYFVATGHYVNTDGSFFYEATDNLKDQSYFLFYVKQEHLKRFIFPLNNKNKTAVKEIIKDIPKISQIATQAESLDICFVDKTYTEILERFTNTQNQGVVLDPNGNQIGIHKGYVNYTIGQRKGFVLKKPPDSPRYVTKIDAKNNTITVGTNDDLKSSFFEICDYNFFVPETNFSSSVKIRSTGSKIPCKVEFAQGKVRVFLDKPARAIAPGQAAVFYDNNKLLGGGWIV